MATFDRFSDLLDYPMYIVTAAAAGERSGCLVGFASQCSIDPPYFMVWLSVANHTYSVARRAGQLAVHVLHHSQRGLADLFGGESGSWVDKFARVAWRPYGDEGTPILDEAAGWFVGRVRERNPTGDHVGFLLDISDVGPQRADRGRLLNLSDVGGLEPGHPA
jgi:flavin reductase (DIM6/NTAB) family NADH-FMN oxidoreductase RutF